MATSRSDYWNETYTPRLMDRAAALPQERRMILFIKKVEGAIGYIPVSKVDKDLKVIYGDGEL